MSNEQKTGRPQTRLAGVCDALGTVHMQTNHTVFRLRNETTCQTEQAKIPALRNSAHTPCRQKHARNLSLVRTTAMPNLRLSCLSLHTSHTQPPRRGRGTSDILFESGRHFALRSKMREVGGMAQDGWWCGSRRIACGSSSGVSAPGPAMITGPCHQRSDQTRRQVDGSKSRRASEGLHTKSLVFQVASTSVVAPPVNVVIYLAAPPLACLITQPASAHSTSLQRTAVQVFCLIQGSFRASRRLQQPHPTTPRCIVPWASVT